MMGKVILAGGCVGMTVPSRQLYLYKDGDECTNVTGGWVENANSSVAEVSTKNFINVSRFSKIYITFMRKRNDTYAYRGDFSALNQNNVKTDLIEPSSEGYGNYITKAVDILFADPVKICASLRNSNSTVYSVTKNADNMELHLYQKNYCDAYLYVKEIWLEK